MFELAHVRSFVTVASELHFGRASIRLNLTQPALSRQIQSLERILKVELFVRTSRSVRLTSAGHGFLREAHRLLEQAETAILIARRSGQEENGAIVIGLIGAATYDVLPRLIRETRDAFPALELSFTEMLTPEQVDALARRRIDLGLGRLPSGARGLRTAVIAREQLLLAIPTKHPLARGERVTLQDLTRHPYIGYEPNPTTSLYELLEQIFRDAQCNPQVVQRSKQTQTVLSLVSAGIGVALVPETAQRASFDNVTFREVAGLDNRTLEMHAIWRPDNDNPALPMFRTLLLSVLG
jgi:DNA-binding transcriptional LysR family regulator